MTNEYEKHLIALCCQGKPKMFGHLVLDAGPLFDASSVLPASLTENFYTVPEVVAEVKDASSRENMSRLPFEVKIRTPSSEALSLVREFAKATGDLATLSSTDIKVIALTVSLELEHNTETSKMVKEPRTSKILECAPSSSVTVTGRKDAPKRNERQRAREVTSFDHESAEEEKKEEPEEVPSDDDDDAGEWITPDNIEKFKKASTWQVAVSKPSPSVQVQVACITTDFAMQNVLLQMRLRLYSPDGRRIKRLKNWLLRCHACYCTTKDMGKKFCPKCGGATLIRTSYSVDSLGQMTLYLRSDFQYNNHGTKYSIPMPKGGRNSRDLMLREDQAEFQRAVKNWEWQQNKAAKSASLDVIDDRLSSVFGEMNIKGGGSGTRSARPVADGGIPPPAVGYGRKNPNQVRRTKK